jgi:hypothetical protein
MYGPRIKTLEEHDRPRFFAVLEKPDVKKGLGCPETFCPCGSIAAARRFAVTIWHESRGLALLLERLWIERLWIERLSRERLLRG